VWKILGEILGENEGRLGELNGKKKN